MVLQRGALWCCGAWHRGAWCRSAWARGAFGAGVRSWQDYALMRSQAFDDGKMLAKCVLGRQSMASFALHASRKRSRTGKSPVRGKIRAPCIRNELALARYARHASEKPCKQPFGNTPREDLAMKGPLSLHGPLESCTARECCHPASTKRPSAHNHAAALMAAHHPQHSRCQRQPHRKRSHTPPPRDTEASGGREILRRPSPAAPKRSSGTNGTAAPHGAIWPQHPQRRWRHQTRCQPQRLPASQTLAAPRANQQQPSAGLLFVPSKARTHHTYLSAAPVAGFSS